MFPKHKRVTLHGQALKKLMQAVYERDSGECVYCHAPIYQGTKCHHVRYRSRGGGDTEDNLVMLCIECHTQVHHGKHGPEIQKHCEYYLRKRYGDNTKGD